MVSQKNNGPSLGVGRCLIPLSLVLVGRRVVTQQEDLFETRMGLNLESLMHILVRFYFWCKYKETWTPSELKCEANLNEYILLLGQACSCGATGRKTESLRTDDGLDPGCIFSPEGELFGLVVGPLHFLLLLFSFLLGLCLRIFRCLHV